ncbi:hypothetical protein ALUC_30092S [Aspergillus luchuensis]|nr:hypothetical protein ALUC_30092S [Aspergillus luchuensis]
MESRNDCRRCDAKKATVRGMQEFSGPTWGAQCPSWQLNSEERSRQELVWSWAKSAVSVCSGASLHHEIGRSPSRQEARPEAQIIGLELQQTKTAPGPHVQIDRFHQQQPVSSYCSIVSWSTGINAQLKGLTPEGSFT